MSLDYSYANVKNSDDVMWDENDRMLPEVESIIFATMAVGINKITEDNYIEFFRRYVMYRYANNYGEPFFDLAKVQEMIGLSTNASTFTDAAFRKLLTDHLLRAANKVVDGHNYKR